MKSYKKYIIADWGKGQQGIKCLTCGLISYNPNDIQFKYCGKCHVFHDDNQNFLNNILQSYRDAEEKVLKDVLKNLLKREPSIDDAKKLVRVFENGVHDWYHLGYEGVELGIVKYNYYSPVSNSAGVEFVPNETFK